MDVHRLDLAHPERPWTRFGPGGLEPQPRYRHESAFFDDRLLIFGGGTSDLVTPLDRVKIYLILFIYLSLEKL